MQFNFHLGENNLDNIKKEDVLKEIDYKRLDCLNKIIEENFTTINQEQIDNFSFTKEAFNKTKTLLIALIAISIIIPIILQITISKNPIFGLSFISYFIFTSAFIHNLNKIKKEYLTENKKGELTKEFFIQKFKENDLEITPKEMDYYNVFLKRYIEYILIKDTNKLSNRAYYFFEKRYAAELTVEELLISTILFKSNSSFIYSESARM